ncbi:GGDEF domain-containing protein [Campylobacter hyointestinalis]|uniref:GGDEF domain-containing protein n=1 Tax=Campylobacter hyointestinalis TaxID=198 RepID=UPI0015EB6F84|nr:diguanylate cyclase [Campylobacter hyointestinalis]
MQRVIESKIYREFIIIYISILFIFSIIYLYYGITFLAFNKITTFVIAIFIYIALHNPKYFQLINIYMQFGVAYNVSCDIITFGWGYGFELYFIGFVLVYYFYIFKNQKPEIMLITIQCLLCLFLYFMTRDKQIIYGDTGFKEAIYILNFIIISCSLLYLHKNLSIVQATKIINLEKNRSNYQKIAEHDFLTGIYNRIPIQDIINQNITLLKNHKIKSMCIILCDLDNFKTINDTFGHIFGDDILKSVSSSLKSSFSKYGELGRWGGEEFLISIKDIDEAYLKEIIDLARIKIENLKPNALNVTATFGALYITDIKPDINLSMLIHDVDQLMYQGKIEGKNRLVFKHYESK